MVFIGTILSYQNTPNTEKAYFQLADDASVSMGQFVSINYSVSLIGVVTSIFRLNPFFEQMHVDLGSLKEKFATNEWNKTVVEVKLLGTLDNDKTTRVQNPPFSGSLVSFAKPEDIRNFLGFNYDGLLLGQIDVDNKEKLDVKLNMSKLLQKHLAILAMSGAGKSYTVSVLLEELLDIPKEKGPLGIVLFDVHGEYKTFAEPASSEYKSYHDKVKYYDASEIRFPLHSLSDSLLFKFLGNISETQQRELRKIMGNMRKDDESRVFDFDDLIKAIEESNLNQNVKNPLLGWVHLASSKKIFAKTGSFSISRIIEPGKLVIIDLSNVLNMLNKQIIVSYLANKLFTLRRLEKVPPFLIVLEEAHQFIPQNMSAEYMKARPIFETIAREGRKFGASLCLVSQRPVNLSTTVLSQCNTHLLMRVINPNDLENISKSSEGLDSGSIRLITGLGVGEGLLVGSSVNHPVFFKVRKRKSSPNKYDLDLNQMAKKYLDKQNKSEKDLDLYM